MASSKLASLVKSLSSSFRGRLYLKNKVKKNRGRYIMRWISSLWVPACVFIQTYVPHKHRCIHIHTHMSIATCMCVCKKIHRLPSSVDSHFEGYYGIQTLYKVHVFSLLIN